MASEPGTAADVLSVALNTDRLNDVRLPEQFSTRGDFRIDLENGDSPVHVHLRFDDALASIVDIAGSNHYLEPNDRLTVDVGVADIDDPVGGTLEVVTGHGSVTESVRVTVDPTVGEEPVRVDSDLSKPGGSTRSMGRREETESTRRQTTDALERQSLPDTGTLLVGVFAGVAIVMAITLQLTIQSLVVTAGLVAVLAAVGVAAWILVAG